MKPNYTKPILLLSVISIASALVSSEVNAETTLDCSRIIKSQPNKKDLNAPIANDSPTNVFTVACDIPKNLLNETMEQNQEKNKSNTESSGTTFAGFEKSNVAKPENDPKKVLKINADSALTFGSFLEFKLYQGVLNIKVENKNNHTVQINHSQRTSGLALQDLVLNRGMSAGNSINTICNVEYAFQIKKNPNQRFIAPANNLSNNAADNMAAQEFKPLITVKEGLTVNQGSAINGSGAGTNFATSETDRSYKVFSFKSKDERTKIPYDLIVKTGYGNELKAYLQKRIVNGNKKNSSAGPNKVNDSSQNAETNQFRGFELKKSETNNGDQKGSSVNLDQFPDVIHCNTRVK